MIIFAVFKKLKYPMLLYIDYVKYVFKFLYHILFLLRNHINNLDILFFPDIEIPNKDFLFIIEMFDSYKNCEI